MKHLFRNKNPKLIFKTDKFFKSLLFWSITVNFRKIAIFLFFSVTIENQSDESSKGKKSKKGKQEKCENRRNVKVEKKR